MSNVAAGFRPRGTKEASGVGSAGWRQGEGSSTAVPSPRPVPWSAGHAPQPRGVLRLCCPSGYGPESQRL